VCIVFVMKLLCSVFSLINVIDQKQEHVNTTCALCVISKWHKQHRFRSASPRPRALCLDLCLCLDKTASSPSLPSVRELSGVQLTQAIILAIYWWIDGLTDNRKINGRFQSNERAEDYNNHAWFYGGDWVNDLPRRLPRPSSSSAALQWSSSSVAFQRTGRSASS